MGFDVTCIPGQIDEELICPICTDVLEDPVQSSNCEHAYCRECIEKWLERKPTCPVDRTKLMSNNLVPASRLMRNMLSRLKINCIYAEHGCSAFMALEDYRAHVATCEHNPKLEVECPKCSMKVPKDELPEHNCVLELRELVKRQQLVINNLTHTQIELDVRIEAHRRELDLLQHYIMVLRSTNPLMRNVGEQLDRSSMIQWGITLPVATVRSWGSLISTPNANLHITVRNALRASGCPLHLTNVLIDRCHERHWPEGLLSLSARRSNQHLLSQYVTRMLPVPANLQPFIVVLGDENTHMPDNLRVSLAIIMVFEADVEITQNNNINNNNSNSNNNTITNFIQ